MELGFAKCNGVFPFDHARLNIEGMEWNPHNADYLRQTPLHLSDGACLFFRNETQKVKELTATERAELEKEDRVKAYPSSTYVPSKEVGVKFKRKEKKPGELTVENGEAAAAADGDEPAAVATAADPISGRLTDVV